MSDLHYLVFRNFKGDFLPQILDEVYIKKIYETFVMGRKDLTIADFGANQGITTYYFAPYAKVIYSVEPSQIHLEVLRKMVELNKLEQVIVCPYAISSKNGTSTFFHSPNPTAFMLTPGVLPPGESEQVETVSMDEFFKRNKIDHLDILKLDIEGEEGKLITSKSFIDLSPKIQTILGEYHDWCGMSKGAFMNTLRDLGYSFEWRNDTQAAVFQAWRT